MNMNRPPSPSHPQNPPPGNYIDLTADEISLRELLTILWEGRRLIAGVMAAVILAAAAYVFIAPAVYEVEVQTLPPPDSSLTAYNSAWRLATGEPPPATTLTTISTIATTTVTTTPSIQAYEIFVRHLMSSALRQNFFDAVYLPAHAVKTQADAKEGAVEAQKDVLWQRFNKELSINRVKDKERPSLILRTTLTLRGKQPQRIANWANQYVQNAITLAQQELSSHLNNEQQQRIQYLDKKITALRSVAETDKQNRIAVLKESLKTAQTIGLQTASNTSDFIPPYANDTMYLRGTRALQADLNVLESRTNNDPFIAGLPNLMEHKRLLESISLPFRQIGVATVDALAVVPLKPVQPKKAMILVLSVIVGAILGAMAAWMRKFFRTTK